MPLFDKRSEISRSQFREILKKTDIKVGLGKPLSENQKARIEKLDFPKKLGETISKGDYARTINRLKSEKSMEQDYGKKIRMSKTVKFLEELEKKGESPK
jgi:hypothetical protein